MDSKITSSFIPHDTSRAPTTRNYRGGLFDLLLLLGIILFIASTALGIGAFLYLQFVEASLESKREQLERAQAAFEPALIAELTRLDDRMQAAEEVLGNHIAPSAFMRLLEDLTLETMSFNNMHFEASASNAMTVQLQGTAQSVNSVALQADLFGKHTAIASPIFSNINRVEEGVIFDVTATLNPGALRYTSVARNRSAVPVLQPTSAATSSESETIPIFGP